MSFDRQIDFVCPHLVVEEALFVNSDRVTVRPLRPIASVNSVRVRVDGEVEVPSQGLYLPAMGFASKRGPYSIRPGVNDTLAVTVNSGPDQVGVLDHGENLSSREVARRMNLAFDGILFDLSSTGRLRVQTRSKGRDATVLIRPTPLATTLGFSVNRQWRGRAPYPGWTLIADSKTLLDRPTRLIVFDDILRGAREYVELYYTTLRQECRRCGGLGVENDWRYGVHGEVFAVRDEALFIQEIQKAVYTVQGSNTFHQWYGTTIFNTVGKKLSASGIVQSFIINDIREAFRRWQNIKKQQEEQLGQFVSDAEYPFRLIGVNLSPSTDDPTVVFVSATVQNRSQQAIQIERGVKLPLPADILGSSTQDGVIRQSLSNFTLNG